jgi:hypothetical protein
VAGLPQGPVVSVTPRAGVAPPNGENGNNSSAGIDDTSNDRIRGEDLRTWLLAYELNIDVYICANKFLMDGFKAAIAREVINMLETAGTDAAQPRVLQLCAKLYGGLSESDQLLQMIFVRVGSLLASMWRRFAGETSEFLAGNHDVAVLILKEITTRHEDDYGLRNLPSMEQGWLPTPIEAFRVQPNRPGHQRWMQ